MKNPSFTHMNLIREERFSANEATYELSLYSIAESGDLCLFVSKNGKGIGHSFFASAGVATDALHQSGLDIKQALIEQAQNDIVRNEFGEY